MAGVTIDMDICLLEKRLIHVSALRKEASVKELRASVKQLRASVKESRRIDFNNRMDELRRYKETHGHVNVSRSDVSRSLYNYCRDIRSGSVTLNDEQRAALNAIGFDLNAKKRVMKTFDERIQDLEEYRRTHGHFNVSISDDPSLYKYCYDMRCGRMTMNDEQKATLNAIGFNWKNATNKRVMKTFDERIQDLEEYRRTHGHFNISSSDDPSLYNYCSAIRCGRVTLNDEQKATLNAIGFDL